MLDILAITGPIFITIALGFATTRLGLFKKPDLRVLGQFVINLALPALVFSALAQRSIGEILHFDYIVLLAVGSLLTAAIGWLWARHGAGQDATGSAYYAMGMSCANSGFVGYPIALLTLGPIGGVGLALNMIVENLLMIPLLQVLAERGQGAKSHWHETLRQSVLSLVRNPLVLSLLAGLAFSLLGWKLPGPVARTVSLFAQASSALSLFVIGGSLVGLHIHGLRSGVAQIAVGKLLLHPLIVGGLILSMEYLGMTPMQPQLRTLAVLYAAMPMLGIYAILAQKHGRDGLAAAALLGTTLASFFSISALLWLFKQAPGWGA